MTKTSLVALLLLAAGVTARATDPAPTISLLNGAAEPVPVVAATDLPRDLSLSLVPYAGYADYQHSATKRHATLGGLYGSLGYTTAHLVEAEVDYMDIAREGINALNQWDTTLVYSNFSLANWKLRLGGHYIATNDRPTDSAWVVFAGADYYVPYAWDLGLDAYSTQYPNYTPSLEVLELTPHWGVTMLKGSDYSVRNELKGYWIHLANRIPGDRTNYFSAEDKVSYYCGAWTLATFGWVGQQVFAVRGDGFTVYNLAETHRGGYGLEASYAFTKSLSVTLRASQEFFREQGRTQNATATTGLVMLNWRL